MVKLDLYSATNNLIAFPHKRGLSWEYPLNKTLIKDQAHSYSPIFSPEKQKRKFTGKMTSQYKYKQTNTLKAIV